MKYPKWLLLMALTIGINVTSVGLASAANLPLPNNIRERTNAITLKKQALPISMVKCVVTASKDRAGNYPLSNGSTYSSKRLGSSWVTFRVTRFRDASIPYHIRLLISNNGSVVRDEKFDLGTPQGWPHVDFTYQVGRLGKVNKLNARMFITPKGSPDHFKPDCESNWTLTNG